MAAQAIFRKSVFINCPFDHDFQPLFRATIFTVHYAGFLARSALEVNDSSQTRLLTIFQLVAACRYGIHDLSRTELDRTSGLPRFNMPLELGIFLGCKQFGDRRQQQKRVLVLDVEPHRYQKFISDIAGQDIVAHNNDPKLAIRQTRDWLRVSYQQRDLPGGERIWQAFSEFQRDLPQICAELQLTPAELTFVDYRDIVILWQQRQDPTRTVERL